MNTELAKRIITEIGRNEISDKITFHVMGEPTLHQDFFEILDYAQKENVRVGLTTNGAGLGGETGKRLLDHDLHQIDISLQTPDEQAFALRKAGSLSFENYFNGILEFFSAYAEKRRETIFKFRFLNTRFRKKRMEKKNGPVSVISSAIEMHSKFQYLAGRIYDILGVYGRQRETAMDHIKSLVSYKWNVVEIYPHVFFETYLLSDWGHAFGEGKIYNAWAGYCFGMRDHFSILYNGDVILCCVDYDGHTAIGNLHQASLKEVLSSKMLGEIIDGFKKYRVVHPYCKRCLGSQTITDWLFKPLVNIMVLHIFKPFFYKHTDLLE